VQGEVWPAVCLSGRLREAGAALASVRRVAPDEAVEAKGLDAAEKVQNHAARSIRGAFETTRTWMTYASPGWLRVASRIELDTVRLAIRCVTSTATIYGKAMVAEQLRAPMARVRLIFFPNVRSILLTLLL
jgi:hypothetical protein